MAGENVILALGIQKFFILSETNFRIDFVLYHFKIHMKWPHWVLFAIFQPGYFYMLNECKLS